MISSIDLQSCVATHFGVLGLNLVDRDGMAEAGPALKLGPAEEE